MVFSWPVFIPHHDAAPKLRTQLWFGGGPKFWRLCGHVDDGGSPVSGVRVGGRLRTPIPDLNPNLNFYSSSSSNVNPNPSELNPKMYRRRRPPGVRICWQDVGNVYGNHALLPAIHGMYEWTDHADSFITFSISTRCSPVILSLFNLYSIANQSYSIAVRSQLTHWSTAIQSLNGRGHHGPPTIHQIMFVKYSSAALAVVVVTLTTPSAAVAFTLPCLMGRHVEPMTTTTLVSVSSGSPYPTSNYTTLPSPNNDNYHHHHTSDDHNDDDNNVFL